MLIQERSTWYQAEEFCQSKNAYLAELIEPEEREAAWNYVKGNFSERLEFIKFLSYMTLLYNSVLRSGIEFVYNLQISLDRGGRLLTKDFNAL